jgi:hypothetical protein
MSVIIVSKRSARARREVHEQRAGRHSAAPGEHARCNHDAIMIRVTSHRGHLVCDALISGKSAPVAQHERSAGRLSVAPSVSKSRLNHDAIMIMLMSHRRQSAGDVLVSRRTTRAASELSMSRLSAALR